MRKYHDDPGSLVLHRKEGEDEHSARRASQPVRVHLKRVLAGQGFVLE